MVDEINWMILVELQKNARIPLKEIASKVGLSSPAVAERIIKMEDAGLIKSYKMIPDMGVMGYPLGVFISIKIRFGFVKQFEELLPSVPEIAECFKLTGHDCMMMKAFVKNPEHLERLNDRLSQFGELTTSLILKSIVKDRVYDKAF